MDSIIIRDFTDHRFTKAFIKYFEELEIEVKDWNGLFNSMNDEKGNVAIVRLSSTGEALGFIQFKIDGFKNWFFEEKVGFIREFWVDKTSRNDGIGSKLLESAEEYFLENNIFKAILTTNSAMEFYERKGYIRDPSYTPLNNDEVFVKLLKQE